MMLPWRWLTASTGSKVLEPDINDESHLRIFERYVIGVGMTPRMVTNVETGENYRDGVTAARVLGVTRQNINNCINGRQETVKGFHLVKSTRFRGALTRQLADICKEHGTSVYEVMDEFKSLN